MASEPKTKPTDVPLADFIARLPDARRREEAEIVAALLTEVSGEPPVMWGPSIVGFGTYLGKTGDWPMIGFSPRKAKLVLYFDTEFEGRDALMARLGKHTTSVACLYLNRLSDADPEVLRELAIRSVAATRAKYSTSS